MKWYKTETGTILSIKIGGKWNYNQTILVQELSYIWTIDFCFWWNNNESPFDRASHEMKTELNSR
jgi:hypothetical protein